MGKDPYVLGIDLGTSHCALSYWRRGQKEISILEVPQIQEPGKIEKKSVLPSCSYLPHAGEVRDSQMQLPWVADAKNLQSQYAVGIWAKKRGSQVSDRFISSAKSWLCNKNVNRHEKILPWQSELKEKQSPIESMAQYLRHLLFAFIDACQEKGEEVKAEEMHVVITVPASFDEFARSLVRDAAKQAGIVAVTLLEEPQAAFYSWIARQEYSWKKQIQAGDLVLVCDVGGGTSDFSLIAVHEHEGELELERISVGEHLLLGGDNMDLTLAYYLKQKVQKEGFQCDRWQFLNLVHEAREAKERMFLDTALQEVRFAFAGKGASLLAQTISTTLTRVELEKVILEGFFPVSKNDEFPKSRMTAGVQELGLNFESDPAISRHLARFLSLSKENCVQHKSLQKFLEKYLGKKAEDGSSLLLPSAVLFNGGVFKAGPLRARVMELLQNWDKDHAVREIQGHHLELAVAHGAGYYGRSKISGHGIRIAAGTARSYYLGLEMASMAIPGIEPEVKGLCVVPQGTEEGSHLDLPSRQFGLVTGEKVNFRFFSSAIRAKDRLGSLVEDAAATLDETSQLEISLPPIEGYENGTPVPVKIDADVTEMGTLQLYMKHVHSDKKWQLEFNVRPEF